MAERRGLASYDGTALGASCMAVFERRLRLAGDEHFAFMTDATGCISARRCARGSCQQNTMEKGVLCMEGFGHFMYNKSYGSRRLRSGEDIYAHHSSIVLSKGGVAALHRHGEIASAMSHHQGILFS